MTAESRQLEIPDRATAVAIESVTKTYRRKGAEVEALTETSFSIDDHEFVSLIGPSGCGKSTLLKIIAGLLDATSGRVALARGTAGAASVSVAFQKPTLLPWRTVAKNILLPLEGRRDVSKGEGQERLAALLRLMHLEDFANHYPRELSGGMEQRVAIARSLISKPELLLMDEPFGALDEFTREALNDELLRIWQQEPKTVVFVTHSITEAVYLSDRIVVMRARPGAIHEIVDVDLPRPRTAEVRNDPRFFELQLRVRDSLERAKNVPQEGRAR